MIADPAQALFEELQADVSAGAFEPAFQPLARLSDGALAGFEALARWRRNGALAPTSLFLSAAIERDLLGDISRTILHNGVRALARWRAQAPKAQALFLSVNVAGADLERGAVVADVVQALQQSGLPASALRVEVTEHQVLRDPVAAATALQALRDLGVRILLDDFGAGYASLHWLVQLPVDAIKFDTVLIDGVENLHSRQHKIVRAMTQLARDLGLETIAEGVETREQRDVLTDFGCNYAQGYFYARGMKEADALALVLALDDAEPG